MRRVPLSSLLPEAVAGVGLLAGLPGLLRRQVSLEEARATLACRLAERADDFLALARRAVYAQPASPYRRLLQLAGCEYGDLEHMVSKDGVEGALASLLRRGVYLTVDEFKGRRPAVRGSARVDVDPRDLRNPSGRVFVPRHTSGSRGPSAPAPFALAHVRERAVGVRLYLAARGADRWRHANWEAPGGGTLMHILEYCVAGASMTRWFTPVRPDAPGLHSRYRWVGEIVRLGGRLARRPQPRPAHAPLDAPLPVVRWMAEVLAAAEVPHLFTYSSAGVRLCQAAREAGIDLRGAKMTLIGEPLTPARLETVRGAGVQAVPRYGSAEASAIGSGCLEPQAADDMHLQHDINAVIQPGADGAPIGLPPRALVLSSLRPATPVILLNVSLGDEADLVQRGCGCPMERHGWSIHVQAVRSFEKLTAGGMTVLDTDAIRILEQVLPSRFGGGPIDYQIVEDEAGDGRPLIRLLVHPGVGPLELAAVADAFLTAIAEGSEPQRLMAMQWRQAGFPLVERRAPLVTGSGKVLHLHLRREMPEAGGASRP